MREKSIESQMRTIYRFLKVNQGKAYNLSYLMKRYGLDREHQYTMMKRCIRDYPEIYKFRYGIKVVYAFVPPNKWER